MRQLHLHLLSLDFASAELKRPRHWIIFNTDYLVPPAAWVEQLERHGRVSVDRGAEMAKVKEEMRCPLTGAVLADMEATTLSAVKSAESAAQQQGEGGFDDDEDGEAC